MLFAAQRGILSGVGEPPPQPAHPQPYRYPQSSDFALNPAGNTALPPSGSAVRGPPPEAAAPHMQPQPHAFGAAPGGPPAHAYPPASPQLPPPTAREYEPIGVSGAGGPPPQYPAYFPPPPSSGSAGVWGQSQPQPQPYQWPQNPPRPDPYYAQRPITGPYNEPIDPNPKPMGGGRPGDPQASPFEAETVANSPKAVRLGFIRKVYGILTAQLVFSIGCIALCVYHDGVRAYVQTNPTLMWVAMAGTIVITLAMACVPALHQNYPTNLVMLSIFTALQGYLLGTISSFYSTTAVMQAVIATAAVTTGLSLYALQTKRDLSKMGSFLFVALLILVMFGFLRLFFPASPIVETIYASVGALIFSAYIVYDTWLIANVLGPDDYIIAALKLYLDIINLFLMLLSLIGGRRR